MCANYTPAFLAYCRARDILERNARQASERLNAIPGVGSGVMGLTPSHVKASPEFQAAHGAYWQAHKALAELNRVNVPRFKRELARERNERREALALGRGCIAPA